MKAKLLDHAASLGDRYPVSVVTPCHNVDLELLTKCFDSLKGHTLGFENIEWVLVIHNCAPGYLANARKRLPAMKTCRFMS